MVGYFWLSDPIEQINEEIIELTMVSEEEIVKEAPPDAPVTLGPPIEAPKGSTVAIPDATEGVSDEVGLEKSNKTGPVGINNVEGGSGNQVDKLVGTPPPPPPPPPPPEPPKSPGETRGAQTISTTKPAYPSSLRRRGIEGAVVVHVSIGSDGSVTGASVSGSSGYGDFDSAAVQAAYSWTFSPALEDGTPVPSSKEIRIRFSLDE